MTLLAAARPVAPGAALLIALGLLAPTTVARDDEPPGGPPAPAAAAPAPTAAPPEAPAAAPSAPATSALAAPPPAAFVDVDLPFLDDPDLIDDDTGWTTRLGALLSVEARAYGHGNEKSDGLEAEAASLLFEHVADDGRRFFLATDFDGEDTRHNLEEAWYEQPLGEAPSGPAEGHWLRVGLLRFEQGTESATRPEDFPLVGVGFPAWLDGRTDAGLRADGYLDSDTWYALGLQGGAGFGKNGHRRRGEALSARMVFTPEPDARGAFEGPFLGVGFTRAFDYDDPLEVATPLEQTVFTTPRLDGSSATFVHLEGGWRADCWRFGAETVRGEVAEVPLPGGGEEDMDQLGSWSAWVAVMLRGETPVWHRGAYQPYAVVQADDDDADALDDPLPIEFALRYSNADIDRMLIDSGITNFAQSTQEVRTFSAALSTQVCADTRLALQWTKTIADQELATFGDRNRDSSWSLRVDQRFGRAGRDGR